MKRTSTTPATQLLDAHLTAVRAAIHVLRTMNEPELLLAMEQVRDVLKQAYGAAVQRKAS